MKRHLGVILALLIVAGAGFGVGQYTMWVKVETVLFAWIDNAHNWQYEAKQNWVAADYYRENAERNVFVAECLKEICDNYTAENADLSQQIILLEHKLAEVLNPEWDVN